MQFFLLWSIAILVPSRILRRYDDVKVENRQFVPIPVSFNALARGDQFRISGWTWYLQKLAFGLFRRWRNHGAGLLFWYNTRMWQTDRQRDRYLCSGYTSACIACYFTALVKIDRTVKNSNILWLWLQASRQQKPAIYISHSWITGDASYNFKFTIGVFEFTTDLGRIRADDYGKHEQNADRVRLSTTFCAYYCQMSFCPAVHFLYNVQHIHNKLK